MYNIPTCSCRCRNYETIEPGFAQRGFFASWFERNGCFRTVEYLILGGRRVVQGSARPASTSNSQSGPYR